MAVFHSAVWQFFIRQFGSFEEKDTIAAGSGSAVVLFIDRAVLFVHQFTEGPLLEPYLAGAVGVFLDENADAAVGHQGEG